MRQRASLGTALLLFLTHLPLNAEDGILALHVMDPEERPLARVVIGTAGSGASAPTDNAGHARIQLAPQTRPFTPVTLQITQAPVRLIFISPWNKTVLVPSFENSSQNYSEVVLARPGDLSILESRPALRAATARITSGNAPANPAEHPTPGDRESRLKLVAADYGLNAADLDRAIRNWGANATSDYDRGLAELYTQRYSAAIPDLSAALDTAEQGARKALAEVADRAFFKGLACYLAGQPIDAATAYERAFQITPDDPIVLNNLALVLDLTGKQDRAEDLFRRSLALAEQQWGAEDSRIVPALNNLAAVLLEKGRASEAEGLMKRGLKIRQDSLPAGDLRIAMSLSNLGALAVAQGHCDQGVAILNEARRIYVNAPATALPQTPPGDSNFTKEQRALVVGEQGHFGSSQPGFSTVLINLSACEQDSVQAEKLLSEALRIEKSQFGPDHPETANGLVALGHFLRRHHREGDGDALLRRALDIRQKQLGPDSPATKELQAEMASRAQ